MARQQWVLLGLLIPFSAMGYDYPTADRVEYVLECMQRHAGRPEYLHKCSCTIDAIAQGLPYDDYVAMSTVARYQSLGGERGGAFRDPENFKEMLRKFNEVRSDANRRCEVK